MNEKSVNLDMRELIMLKKNFTIVCVKTMWTQLKEQQFTVGKNYLVEVIPGTDANIIEYEIVDDLDNRVKFFIGSLPQDIHQIMTWEKNFIAQEEYTWFSLTMNQLSYDELKNELSLVTRLDSQKEIYDEVMKKWAVEKYESVVECISYGKPKHIIWLLQLCARESSLTLEELADETLSYHVDISDFSFYGQS